MRRKSFNVTHTMESELCNRTNVSWSESDDWAWQYVMYSFQRKRIISLKIIKCIEEMRQQNEFVCNEIITVVGYDSTVYLFAQEYYAMRQEMAHCNHIASHTRTQCVNNTHFRTHTSHVYGKIPDLVRLCQFINRDNIRHIWYIKVDWEKRERKKNVRFN